MRVNACSPPAARRQDHELGAMEANVGAPPHAQGFMHGIKLGLAIATTRRDRAENWISRAHDFRDAGPVTPIRGENADAW